MNDDLENIYTMVGALLAEKTPTPETIREHIARVRKGYPNVTDIQAEQLATRFEEIHDVTMDIGSTLEKPGFEKWLDDRQGEIDFFYWRRYKKLLAQKKFSSRVLATLDRVTDRTLGLLQNPKKEGAWDRRGMVVGHVQSGKTANYTGLICKAADAGYKVIIVIAGLHNSLRSQTQVRIDEGFIGFESWKPVLQIHSDRTIGVGKFDRSRRPATFTNTIRDFNKSTATSVGIPLQNLNHPVVFVVKKNTHTLNNLREWLQDHNAKSGTLNITEPMLLIDDEADNASINIKKGKDEVSRINGLVRQLLKIFERSCYIGYTATPFANILIDPQDERDETGKDLFPRDFIVSLDPPDNYFGADRVFTGNIGDDENGSSVVRHIMDNEDLLPLKHAIDHNVDALPSSLEDAVRTFVLARAVRLIRGQTGQHNSMLVNVSRFTSVQKKIRDRIHIFLVERLKASIRVNGQLPEADSLHDREISELKRVFDIEFRDSCGVAWNKVQERLWDAVSPIKVIEINSTSSDKLNYPEQEKSGLNVIAVGGFSLSRGLTLEGLMISYFLRNSMMYDTLMQMGRWFGYRPGYEDLCRIWMPEEAEGWYAHIAESIEELREEFRQMEEAGATPSDFGLKVRSHPDNLIVTARNKRGTGEELRISIGLANRFVETTAIPRSQKENREAAKSFAKALERSGKPIQKGENLKNGYLLRGVGAELVLSFLRSYKNAPGSLITEIDPLVNYISGRTDGELATWNLYVPGISNADDTALCTNLLGVELVCQRRKEGVKRNPSEIRITNNQRVATRGAEKIDLTPAQRETAEATYRNELRGRNKKNLGPINYPDIKYREQRTEPLLILHLLAIGEKDQDLSAEEPAIAWSISFPKSNLKEKTVEYVVNTTWLREHYTDEGDDDDAGGDE